MKTRKGFTIIEILAVIVIMAIVMVIAVPAIFKVTKKSSENLYCSKLEIVQKSAERYADDNSLVDTCEINGEEYNCEAITIQDLINDNYIDSDGLDGAFIDPRDKSSINTMEVLVYSKNSRSYAYVNDSVCPSLVTSALSPTALTNVKHTVTFVLGGGTWSGTNPTILRENATLYVNDPVKAGNEFLGWTKSNESSTLENKTLKMGTEDLVLTADWHTFGYNLTVNADGGTWSGTTPQVITSGDTVTINDPVKSGFAFAGWTVTGTGSSVNGTTFTMGSENTTITANWSTTTPYTFAYTGGSQTFTAPANGYYYVELWGASGATSGGVGGNGTYTSGKIYLAKDEIIYIYVGGVGAVRTGGYNGGGTGSALAVSGSSYKDGGGGGGATDIRLTSGTWNDSASLNSRIMTAAGGGGGAYITANYNGGTAGGLAGNSAVGRTYTILGGSQIGDYAFGYGQNGGAASSSYSYGESGRGGGGGGYWGGSASQYGANGIAGGGGGSSFISGYAGVNAISSSSSITPTYNTIHYSGKYFINNNMLGAINTGNGSAKITYTGLRAPTKLNPNLNNVRYIKDCINGSPLSGYSQWVELQAIYQGNNVAKGKTVTGTGTENSSFPYSRTTDGDLTSANYSETLSTGLQCITVDLTQSYNLDEIAVWHYWVDGRTYNSNVTYVSSDNSNWTSVIDYRAAEGIQGKRVSSYSLDYNYGYTGSVQTFTAPYSGYYLLETWGAQGGYAYTTTYIGGYGAYAEGVTYLTAGTTLYIYVGSGGVNGTSMTATSFAGGYNGGGAGFGNGDKYAGGGGGATHIATTSGLLSTLSANQSALLIAAGGGGGASFQSTSYYGYLGHGGGINGVTATKVGSYASTGGTQTAGGTGYVAGSFGQGAIRTTNGSGGGGGGYYGGGSAQYYGGASGGSSYIANSSLVNYGSITKSMYCYNCTTSATASTLTYSSLNVSSAPVSNYAKAGDGHAKITFIGN